MAYGKISICWECANCTKCNWAKGEPVEGWTAKEKIINNGSCGKYRTYFVEQCPQFKADKIVACSYKKIAELLGESVESVSTLMHRNSNKVQKRLLEMGYNLKRYDGDCYWWIERVD